MDKEKLWKNILEVVKGEVSLGNYKTWFSQTTLVDLNDTKLIIAVPSAFVKGQLLSRYESILHKAIEQVMQKSLEIDLMVDPSLTPKKVLPEKEEEEEEGFFNIPKHQASSAPPPLSPKYTLESFVVGLTNNLAYAAAQAVVQNPGSSYNPLFIYGHSGVGKTHLMQGIGNALLKKNPYLKLVFASSEKFMNDFVESIQTKTTGPFRQRYRYCDILLIDDIQFISGKEGFQEEFFHTYNDLHTRNSQLVFTSDRPPNEIQKLENRLLSRFQGGLMVDMQLPDFDTRMAILKTKLAERGEIVPEDILQMIAESVASNTRELEGKLIQVLQMSKLMGQSPNEEVVKKALGTVTVRQNAPLDHKKLLLGVNQYFNLKMADILGPRRQKELVLPRQIAMYLMYLECKMPFERIGEVLGGRDHTTVMHGVEKIKESVSRDREIQRMIIEIKQQLSI